MHDLIPSDKYNLVYDTESTQLDFIGQLVTIYLCLTNSRYEMIPGMELDLKIKISPIELPHPDAIATNRLNVIEHNRKAMDEYDACELLVNFIEACLQKCGSKKIMLLGFNSSRFDLPFLRVILIRNGFNPYFKGRLVYGDALHLIKKIAIEHSDFPQVTHESEEMKYYVYNLQSLSERFGLSERVQMHDAKDDVMLLLRLLNYLQETYGANIWNQKCFCCPSNLFMALEPAKPEEYPQAHIPRPFAVLDSDGSTFLFIDLLKFQEKQSVDCIVYRNASTGFLLGSNLIPVSQHFVDLSQAAKILFSHITAKNFFPKTDCDIEQDIYRLSFFEIDLLKRKIKNPALDTSKSTQDFRQLWRRYRLRHWNPEAGNIRKEDFGRALSSYAYSRYVKGLKLNKYGEQDRYNLSWKALLEISKNRLETSYGYERELMLALQQFYDGSFMKPYLNQIFANDIGC